MSDLTAVDTTGELVFSLTHLDKHITYNPDGTLLVMTVGPDTRGFSYEQTYFYTDGTMSGMSGWVKK
jgi:hypothetical protein